MIAQKQPVTAAPQSSAIHRVMLVDESRLQRRILSAALARDGFDVVEAGTAEEALNMCQAQMPDLILSDWVLPDKPGSEFCKEIRDLPSDHYCYFVFLTAKSERDEVVKSLESGADDFLLKPVDAHELRARMSAAERILRMQRELTEKNRVIGDTLHELQRVHENVDKDLQAAKQFQDSLVRERTISFPKGHITMMLHSSGHVGGDLVGHYPISETRMGLFAIDVSGHGISSALMTARLAGYLSASAPEQNIALQKAKSGGYRAIAPHRVVQHLNQQFLDDVETDLYFTMVLADFDQVTGRVRLTQAGHPHPLVQRADGRVEQLGTGGLPVGLVPDAEYSEFETTLAAGDRLVILSDGVVECPNAHGDMLDDVGVQTLMTDLTGLKGEAFFETLFWRLQEFAGSKTIPDDVSGVLLEFHPKDAPTE